MNSIDMLAEVLVVASAMSLVGELTPEAAKLANSLLARQNLPAIIVPIRRNGRHVVKVVDLPAIEVEQWTG